MVNINNYGITWNRIKKKTIEKLKLWTNSKPHRVINLSGKNWGNWAANLIFEFAEKSSMSNGRCNDINWIYSSVNERWLNDDFITLTIIFTSSISKSNNIGINISYLLIQVCITNTCWLTAGNLKPKLSITLGKKYLKKIIKSNENHY